MRRLFCTIGSALLLSANSTSAFAASPINQWLCKVVKAPFDPKAAIASFPLEKLPEPTTSTRSRGQGDDKVNYVEMASEGESYQVEYKYGYKENDVTSPYGFQLTINSVSYDQDFLNSTHKWLKEFGKPVQDILGFKVSAGKPTFAGSDKPFYFSAWSAVGNYSANWFYANDIKYAPELCNKL